MIYSQGCLGLLPPKFMMFDIIKTTFQWHIVNSRASLACNFELSILHFPNYDERSLKLYSLGTGCIETLRHDVSSCLLSLRLHSIGCREFEPFGKRHTCFSSVLRSLCSQTMRDSTLGSQILLASFRLFSYSIALLLQTQHLKMSPTLLQINRASSSVSAMAWALVKTIV